MSGASRRRRRTGGVLVATATVLAVGAAAGAGFGFDGLRGGGSGDDAGADLPPATATVTRETLVDTQTEDGELGYGDPTTLTARLGGTLTRLPASGSTVKRGHALYLVDNQPVLLLYGSLPAYRTLAPGTEGADVEQFERNLRALGYTGFTVDEVYSGSTAEAVKDWQDDLGLRETGTVELGRVVYATGPVRVDSREAAVGDAVQPGKALLSYTGLSPVVTVELDVADQRLARKGATVSVTLPDGKIVTGKITNVETVVDTGGGDEGNPGDDQEAETTLEVTVTIGDKKALAGLGQASVQVDFTASKRENVLTVPVAALLALAEGGYGVEVVEGRKTRIIAVETGLFADGRVEVTGDGLSEGKTVGMPS